MLRMTAFISLAAFLLLAGTAIAASKRDWDDCKSNDFDRTIRGCTRVLQDRSEDAKNRAVAHYNRARVYRENDEDERALADYTESIRLDPAHPYAWYNRGNIYADQGDFERAIADFTQAIRLSPKRADYYAARGEAHLDDRELDRAIADFDQALRLDRAYLDAYIGRGRALLEKRDFDRALADFNAAIRIAPKDPAAYSVRATAYEEKGEFDRAIADANRAMQLAGKPDFWDYIHRASAYRAAGKYPEALKDLQRAAGADNNKKEMPYYYHLGWTLQAMGKHDEAIAAFTDGIPTQPDYWAVYFRRALSYEQKGERDKAADDLKKTASLIKVKHRDEALNSKLAQYGLR
jgi:tetratricopeptide (TPR) repeat protein